MPSAEAIVGSPMQSWGTFQFGAAMLRSSLRPSLTVAWYRAAGNRTPSEIALSCGNAESGYAKVRETTCGYAIDVDGINIAAAQRTFLLTAPTDLQSDPDRRLTKAQFRGAIARSSRGIKITFLPPTRILAITPGR
jgi:hypothetical protein